MSETKGYVVTDRAGKRVAGRVATSGQILTLTAEEAEYDLREGAIVPEGEKVSSAFAKSKLADGLRADARTFREARAAEREPAAAASDAQAVVPEVPETPKTETPKSKGKGASNPS